MPARTIGSRCSGWDRRRTRAGEAGSLLRLQNGVVSRRGVGLAHAARADLVLRDLADRVLRRDGQTVGALVARPVVGDEDRIRPYRRDDHGPQREGAATSLADRPFTVGDAELLG